MKQTKLFFACLSILSLSDGAWAEGTVLSEPQKYALEFQRVSSEYTRHMQEISAAADASEFDVKFHELKAFVAHPGNDKYSNHALCGVFENLPLSELEYHESFIEGEEGAISLKSCRRNLKQRLATHLMGQKVNLHLSDTQTHVKRLPFEVRTVSEHDYLSHQGLNEKEVMLTFDDGPTKKTTVPILETLKQAGVKAVFFSTGRQAQFNKDVAQQILKEGHLLGSHSYFHSLMMGREVNRGNMTHDYFLTEMIGGHVGVYLASGHIDPYFRFPNGCMNKNMRRNANELGIKIFGWSVDSQDWRFTARAYPDLSQRRTAILKTFTEALSASKNRGIVLMHDVFSQSAEALPLILNYLADNNFKVVLLVPKERHMGNHQQIPIIGQALHYMKREGLKLKDIIPPSKDAVVGDVSPSFESKVRFEKMFPQLTYQYSPADPLTKSCGY